MNHSESGGAIERYKNLYAAKDGGHLLVKTSFPMADGSIADFAINYVSLLKYDLQTDNGLKQYFDEVADRVIEEKACHEEVGDDWIPELFIHLGSGIVESFIRNADIKIAADTSWTIPSAPFQPGEEAGVSPWIKKFQTVCDYLEEKYDGLFNVFANFHYSPLDAVNYLRGTDMFAELYAEPEMIKTLLEFCVQKINFLKKQFSTGGQSMWNVWFPVKDGLTLQEDTATLVSPKDYLTFGRDYSNRIFADTGGMVHTHMLGIHQFENMAAIGNLYMLNIASDPNCKKPTDAVDEIYGAVRNKVPVFFECEAEELYEKIQDIKRLNAVLWVYCKDKNEAKSVTDFIRKNSKIG